MVLSLAAFIACDKPEDDYIWNDNWQDNTETPESGPEKPDGPGTDTPEVKEGKARLVWIDAAANFNDYANSRKNIANCSQTGT